MLHTAARCPAALGRWSCGGRAGHWAQDRHTWSVISGLLHDKHLSLPCSGLSKGRIGRSRCSSLREGWQDPVAELTSPIAILSGSWVTPSPVTTLGCGAVRLTSLQPLGAAQCPATPCQPRGAGSAGHTRVTLGAAACAGLLSAAQGARNRSFFYPRKLKTTMIVYLKNSVLFALRNASTEPLLLPSPLALPILLLPLLCCSVSYHFLLPTLPGDCARHGLKIKSFQRRNLFATMEADVNKTQ